MDAPLAASAGFPPVADPNAETLLLGSMPGDLSLRRHQYYAHPRNAFWPILGELTGALPALPYEARLSVLRRHRIALWDVLAACVRRGSLDSAIVPDSVRCNDFEDFFRRHPRVRRVFFNGAYAETTFRPRVLPGLPSADGMAFTRLPSTSPANAAWDFERKLSAWRAILATPAATDGDLR